ncbi:helix-turn-helix transcriptional regulator [Archangium violaceum]|uniref:helix-turn-helix domain-containing protein n=1 Tax=Archangium violaceum TaxID=83451 RepID=UPI002B29648B|nr:helix-turn-helix transcriptional regulator [Archangium violaceum]
MIKNEREYRITLARAAEFERSLEAARQRTTSGLPSRIAQAQVDALLGQLEELRAELAEYEALKSGKRKVLDLVSLEELPRALIESRIAAGLTQKDLAQRLGIPEQQVQRYEATEYAGASLARIQEIVRALGLNIRKEVFLPTVDVSTQALTQRLQASGLDANFFTRRLFGETAEENDSATALKSAGLLSRVFGWMPSDLFAGTAPLLPQAEALGAQFKLPENANESRTAVYAIYARFVAGLTLKAVPAPNKAIPRDAQQLRNEIVQAFGEITLESVLAYLWEHGVPVIPLEENGGFHAACWRMEGRNAIVLKQKTDSEARWLHDLLHEVYHIAGSPESPDFAYIEQGLGPFERRDTDEEKEATAYAADVLLKGQAEAMVKECVNLTKGKIPKFKSVVPEIAERHQVSVGALANYIAWRLSLQGRDWWGAATNLQEHSEEEPLKRTRAFLFERLDWSKLERRDQDLLIQAFAENR